MLTGRVIKLRAPSRADVETLYEMDSDAEHIALSDDHPFVPRSLASIQAEHDKRETEPKHDFAFFAVQRLEDENGAGTASFSAAWNGSR